MICRDPFNIVLAAARRFFARPLLLLGTPTRRPQACSRLPHLFTVGALLLGSLPVAAAELSGTGVNANQRFESAALRWNWEAQDIVRRNRIDPLWAVRTYAMVSVAQYEAAIGVKAIANKVGSASSVAVAIASSSAMMLAHLYPHEVPRIGATFHAHLEELSSSVAAKEQDQAQAIGEAAALSVLQERQADGAISLDTVAPPAGTHAWHSSERWAPLRTYWGRVRPFLVRQVSEFGAPPPPALESAQFREALATVKSARSGASGYNDRIAKKWADGPGTATPAGHWNQIAAELITRNKLDELESAQVLALLNMALTDASILCWRSKFEYWLLRPPQADPEIVPSFALPNFPSYPSGHAAFSGAASAFLAYRFPSERDELARLAEEAAMSRVVSGIHYPFDSEAGLEQGRRIAALAIAQYRREVPPRVSTAASKHPTHRVKEDRP